MEIKSNKTYTIELTQDELLTLINGIGSTSYNSRIDAGMDIKQSKFMEELWEYLTDKPVL